MRPFCFRLYSRFPTSAAFLATCFALATVFLADQVDGAPIVSCGFEATGDTWSFTSASGGTINTNAGNADYPSNQRIAAGEGSWIVAGAATSTLTFSDVLLSGWNGVSIGYRVSSTASVGTAGHGGGDQVEAYVAQHATELGSTSPLITMKGFGAAVWGYNSGADQKTATYGASGITFQPGSSGTRTNDGYNNFKIAIPDGTTSVALRLFAKSSSVKTYWNIDNVVLDGTPTISHDCVWAGGSGTWSNSAGVKPWRDPSSDNASAWNNTNGDNARFMQPGNVVTIAAGATVAARSLTFDADGCTIAAGDSTARLALTNGGSGGPGGSTVEVTSVNDTATISAAITENPNVGLTKTGEGTLVLNGVNTLSGTVGVQQGTLRLGSSGALIGCSVINVAGGAALDVSAVPDFHLGIGGKQTLEGAGTIIGNLQIDSLGAHDVGNSPDVQQVQGNYTMNGTLLVEVGGDTPGNGTSGYDQVVVADALHQRPHDISLGGSLDLIWSGAGWSSAADRLWILRNDTTGALNGTFTNYGNHASLGNYDGRVWSIYYGADADTGLLVGGNDVLLMATPVPEPGSLVLLSLAVAAFWLCRCR